MVLPTTAILILAGLVTVTLWRPDPYDDRPFSRQVWLSNQLGHSASSDPVSKRRGMVEDLRERHLRLGMSRQEVRKLLGGPDVFSVQPANDSYGLAYTGPGGSDLEKLILQYDKLDRLVRVKVGYYE